MRDFFVCESESATRKSGYEVCGWSLPDIVDVALTHCNWNYANYRESHENLKCTPASGLPFCHWIHWQHGFKLHCKRDNDDERPDFSIHLSHHLQHIWSECISTFPFISFEHMLNCLPCLLHTTASNDITLEQGTLIRTSTAATTMPTNIQMHFWKQLLHIFGFNLP